MDEKPLDLSALSPVKLHFPHILPDFDPDNIDEIDAARFHIWFEHRAAQSPGLLALHSAEQGRSMTYQHLNEEANRKAHCRDFILFSVFCCSWDFFRP